MSSVRSANVTLFAILVALGLPAHADIYDYTEESEEACLYFMTEFLREQSKPAVQEVEFGAPMYFAGQALDLDRYLTIRWDAVSMVEGRFVDLDIFDGVNFEKFEAEKSVTIAVACKIDVKGRQVLELIFSQTMYEAPTPTFVSRMAATQNENARLAIGLMAHGGKY